MVRIIRESGVSPRTMDSRCGFRLARAVVVLSACCFGWDASAEAASDLACIMKPSMEVSVGAPVEGIIQEMAVDRGEWVSKGQVIVTLEASVEKATVELAKAKAEAEATIKSTQAKIAFSTRKLERAMGLYKTNSIARHELDEAQTEKVVAEMAHQEAIENKRIAELEWQRAAASLNLHTIYSPLTGVVVDRLLSPGELARQTPILKLAQIDPLWIEVFAPLNLLGKLAPGLKAEVHPEGSGDDSTAFLAEITAVNRVVDSVSGTFGVRLQMPNPNNAIPAGLPCTVKFHTVE
jgi:RND family efflux transporter MFP subunit